MHWFRTAVLALVSLLSMGLLAGCRQHQSASSQVWPRAATAPNAPKEVALDLGNQVTLQMVLIPAGSFVMGDGNEDAGPWETPHTVMISRPFYMGIHEVTKKQYSQIMGKLPRNCDPGPQMPVDEVTWQEAVDFCEKMSEEIGARVRLPTEAEWEYACRAGSTTRFSFGDDEAELGEYGCCPYRRGPDPVGLKKPNAFGLYDMHGNVEEWCMDGVEPYPSEPQTDPVVPARDGSRLRSPTRILRGGSCIGGASYCRSAARQYDVGDSRLPIRGFRIVME